MTVGELIEELRMLDENALVILQKDGEGNGYSPLAGADGDNLVYNTWSGKVMYAVLTDKLKNRGYTKEDVYGYRDEDDEFEQEWPEAVACAVLFPTN